VILDTLAALGRRARQLTGKEMRWSMA